LWLYSIFYVSKDCHNEASVIEKKWKPVETTGKPKKLSIDMYAFRFASSSSVTIECSAFVCPASVKTGDCDQV
jgi:hypothetical protein